MDLADVCFDTVEAIPHPYRFTFADQLIPAGISMPSEGGTGSDLEQGRCSHRAHREDAPRPRRVFGNPQSRVTGNTRDSPSGPSSLKQVLDSGARRPDGKARRPRIPGVFEGEATPPAGMPRPEGGTCFSEDGPLIPNPMSLIPRPKPPIPGYCSNALIAVLLAPVCAVCDAILHEPLSGCVCGHCWGSIRPITPPVCDRCGDPLARPHQSLIPNPQSPIPSHQSAIPSQSLVGHSEPLCGQCGKAESAVDRARAVGEYDGALREIIHALKYQRRRSLARPLAALMRTRGAAVLEQADYIVPVPLHWRRQYGRGFNQAREIARHLGPPVVDVLVRRRATRAQVELAADRRRANVAGAFGVRRRWFHDKRLRRKKLVLIDDVSTTGATLEACARVLKESGASEVYALTAARVVTVRRHDHT